MATRLDLSCCFFGLMRNYSPHPATCCHDNMSTSLVYSATTSNLQRQQKRFSFNELELANAHRNGEPVASHTLNHGGHSTKHVMLNVNCQGGGGNANPQKIRCKQLIASSTPVSAKPCKLFRWSGDSMDGNDDEKRLKG